MKTVHLLAVGIAAAMALGAAGGYGLSQFTQADEADTDVGASTTSASTTTQPSSREGMSTAPIGGGAWERNLMIATGDTLDSLGVSTVFVENAGVPSVVQRADGTLLAAFQWFPEDNDEAFDKVAVSSSTDGGASWSDPELIVIYDFPEGYQRPFDPTLAVLEDGSVRLYFTSSTEERPGPGQMTEIYAATSEDGVTYTYDGQVFAVDGERAYDSAVVFFDDAWHISTPHAPDQGAYHGISEDGLNFVLADEFSNESDVNWTGNLYVFNELVYFFGTATRNSDGELWFSGSSDMITWSDALSLNISGGDPAAVYVQDQGWIIIYVGESEDSE